MSLLGEEEREEVDLEEEVAELVEELLGRARGGRVRDLVRLLDGVRDDRPSGLLAVPGTVPAKALRQLLELEERLRQTVCAYLSSGSVSVSPVVPVAVAVGGGAKPTW